MPSLHHSVPALPRPVLPRPVLPRLVHLLSALLLLAVAAFIWAPDSQAGQTPGKSGEPTGSGLSWTFTPAADDRGQPRTSLRAVLDPGEEFTDEVVLTNTGGETATFAVYAADGMVTHGGFDILLPGVESSAAGTWVSTELSEVTLEAGQTRRIEVAVRVPEEATPGDWPVGIVAGVNAPGQDDGLLMQTRVGVRMHLQVNGELTPGLAISEVTNTTEHSWNPFTPGRMETSFTLTNVGNVRLGAESVIQLASPGEMLSATSTEMVIPELLPGDSVRVEQLRTELWPTFRAEGDILITPMLIGQDQLDMPLVPVTAALSVWVFPWAQAAVVIVLLILILLWRSNRARRKAARERELDQARQAGAREAFAAAP